MEGPVVEAMVKELGAVGVMAALLLLLVRWMLKDFTEQMKAQTCVLLGIQKEQHILIQLMVRSSSPSFADTNDEKAREALELYKAIDAQLQQLNTHTDEQLAIIRKMA